MRFNSIEYVLMPIPFIVLTLCGTWCPQNWSRIYKRLYKCFTILILCSGMLLVVEVSLYNILTTNRDSFLEDVFVIDVLAVGLYKKILTMCYRNKIMKLVRDCTDEAKWYHPRNVKEKKIQSRNNLETRRVSLTYGAFIGTSVILVLLQPVYMPNLRLPFRAWYPYEVNASYTVLLTYLHQIVSAAVLAFMHLTSDALFVSFLLQARYRLDILRQRLKTAGKLIATDRESTNIKDLLRSNITECIIEHENIYRFIRVTEKVFNPFILGQMIFMIPNLITNIYILSTSSIILRVEIIKTILFTLAQITQILMFCWYANEVSLSSSMISDATYENNWIDISETSKKLFLTIAVRSSQPIKMRVIKLIPLSLGSFIQIMKISYSAFNLLQSNIHRTN